MLHGVKINEVEKGALPISMAESSIIGLVGTADPAKAPQNEVKLISNRKQLEKEFGKGGTIPFAVDAIFSNGGAKILAVNTVANASALNEETSLQKTNLVLTQASVELGKKSPELVKVEVLNGDTPYKENEDYKVDYASGKLEKIAAGSINNTPVTIKIYTASIVATDISTSLGQFDACASKFGMMPKILIAPYFSEHSDSATALQSKAKEYHAMAIVDVPRGNNFTQAKAAHTALSAERVIVCYPYVKAGDINVPYSQYLAGVIVGKDSERGFWWSPSNTDIQGITGMAVELTARINDQYSEVNQLNQKGITSIFKSFGTGFRVWGNSSISQRAGNTKPTKFVNVRRTADILHESVEKAMLQFIDRPINTALVDGISESVNSFMRTLISKGALIDGKCWFDPAKNEATAIAAGHLTFDVEFMPPTPAEKISFESFININMLKSIGE